jgi:TRAP-type C4-dicarboxylate transport system substrate-binding protein
MLVAVMLVVAACGNTEAPATEEPAETTPAEVTEPAEGEYAWAQDYTWKFTHEGTPGLGEDIFATAFAQLINEKSDGHINIEVYEFNQLGASADQLELVQSGAVEFGLASAGAVASLVPEVSIFGLHYVFPAETQDMWDYLADSELTDMLSEYMLDANFKVFCWNIEGPHVWSAKKEIHTLDDMKGLKFRTQANQLEMASFNAYGANATTIAFAELYSALQLGTVDAQQQTALANNVMNYYDVAPYYIQAHASYYVDAPVCNADFYEGLDPYVQDLLMEAFLEAREILVQFLITDDAVKAKDVAVDEHGVTWVEFTPEEQAAFAEKAVAVRDVYLEIGGENAQAVLDTLIKEMNL